MTRNKNYRENTRTDDYETLNRMFCHLIEGTLLHGNLSLALEVVAEEVVGVRAGDLGFYKNKEEFRMIYESTSKVLSSTQGKSTVFYGETDIRIFSTDFALVSGKVNITNEAGDQSFNKEYIQMASARKENGKWLFYMLSAAPMMTAGESDEFYPYDYTAASSNEQKPEICELKARKLAAIVAVSDAGIIVKDRDGVVIDWNTGAENILGYKPEEIIGKTTHSYAPEESHTSIDELESRLCKGEHIVHVDVVRKHKDGRLIDCAASYTPMFDSAGNFDGYAAIFHDITDKRQIDQVLKRAFSEMANQTHLMQVLIDTIPHPVFYKDAVTRFLGCNIAYCETFGIDAEELIGRTVLDLDYLPMEDRIAYQEEDRKIINESGHISYEMPMPFADGKVHETLYSVTGFKKEDGSPGGLIGIFIDIADIREAERALEAAKREVEEHHQIILQSIDYASKIQRNMLPPESIFKSAFSDYSVKWDPRDTVGGDIYWLKSFTEGSVLCICDCTGHGTPGALLTMVVASTFDMTVNESNYKNTAQIIWELEKRLVSILNVEAFDKKNKNTGKRNITDICDGCDLAVLFIAKDGTVKVSSGNIHVFICDGKTVTQIKGQKIFVGEGEIKSIDDINTITIPANRDNKFYIASDGLYDQLGGENIRPFGYGAFKRVILENHNEQQSVISHKVWQAFEDYRGKNPRVDDFEFISFKPLLN